MADEADAKPKKGKGLLMGMLAAVLLGAGGAYATYSGLLTLPFLGKAPAPEAAVASVDSSTAYVVLDPIVVELGRGARDGRLRVALTLQTNARSRAAVEDRRYRVVDTLNSFLRAVDMRDLRDASKIEMIRARMLRRVLLETPRGAVSDVLISEFVII